MVGLRAALDARVFCQRRRQIFAAYFKPVALIMPMNDAQLNGFVEAIVTDNAACKEDVSAQLVVHLDFQLTHPQRERGNGDLELPRWFDREREIAPFNAIPGVIAAEAVSQVSLLHWDSGERKTPCAVDEVSWKLRVLQCEAEVLTVELPHHIHGKHVSSLTFRRAAEADGTRADEENVHCARCEKR